MLFVVYQLFSHIFDLMCAGITNTEYFKYSLSYTGMDMQYWVLNVTEGFLQFIFFKLNTLTVPLSHCLFSRIKILCSANSVNLCP